MKLLTIAAAVLGLVVPALSFTTTYVLKYDTFYDNGHNSLSNVTCAHGEHGLLTHGYTTLHTIHTFPNLGGAPQISAPNSGYCGSCWELTYTDPNGASTSLNFTAVSTSGHDSKTFTISLEGMDFITHGQGKKLKSVPITATRKSPKACGL